VSELTENILRLQYESFKKYVDLTEKEIETLRAKLVKANKLADLLGTYLVNDCYHCVPTNDDLSEALKEYRGET